MFVNESVSDTLVLMKHLIIYKCVCARVLGYSVCLFIKKNQTVIFQASNWSHIISLCNIFEIGLKYSLNWQTWILKGKLHSFSWEEMWDFHWKLKKRSALGSDSMKSWSELEHFDHQCLVFNDCSNFQTYLKQTTLLVFCNSLSLQVPPSLLPTCPLSLLSFFLTFPAVWFIISLCASVSICLSYS